MLTFVLSPNVNRNHFQPLTAIQEENEPGTLSATDAAGYGVSPEHRSRGYGGGWSRNANPHNSTASDEMPLTRDQGPGGNDFSYSSQPSTAPNLNPSADEEYDLGAYPGRRRRGSEGEGALWQQNRRSHNPTWM